jgi:hypothetical protein
VNVTATVETPGTCGTSAGSGSDLAFLWFYCDPSCPDGQCVPPTMRSMHLGSYHEGRPEPRSWVRGPDAVARDCPSDRWPKHTRAAHLPEVLQTRTTDH